MTDPLLVVDGLTAEIRTRRGIVRPVADVSFQVGRGEVLGFVGESGSGKSLTCLALLRLLPRGGRIVGGSIRFDGEDVLAKSPRALRRYRGRQVAVILQDPMTALNPLLTVGAQVMEPLRQHRRLAGTALREAAMAMLRLVRLPRPAQHLRDYPHQLSGGMRQRALGAVALSCDPALLIADEPTTSLDVTIQDQYLALIQDIIRARKLSVIFVTHDMGLVARMCQRVAVMYAGTIVEQAPVEDIFDRPAHPYTRALIEALPRDHGRRRRLSVVPGQPPLPREIGRGCAFAPRCGLADRHCAEAAPPNTFLGPDRQVRCWRASDAAAGAH